MLLVTDAKLVYNCNKMPENKIINVRVRDVRFPTSLEQHGSDAMVRFFMGFSSLVFISVILCTNNNECITVGNGCD